MINRQTEKLPIISVLITADEMQLELHAEGGYKETEETNIKVTIHGGINANRINRSPS
ncbi:MAG: hypothetical protein AB8C40_03845 [Gammaproteobacteria bacterium]